MARNKIFQFAQRFEQIVQFALLYDQGSGSNFDFNHVLCPNRHFSALEFSSHIPTMLGASI